MTRFTVQDTRAWAAPRVDLEDAGAPILRHLESRTGPALAHAAAGTGVPAWCPPPRLDDPAKLNCRVLAMAEESDPALTRDEVLERSRTTRTGVMPVRLGFADRVAAVILLVNTAFHRQYGLFRDAQHQMRTAAPPEAHASMLPEDVADFEFVLQWRELRDELTGNLRKHYEAATRAFAATPGTPEHQEASIAAQRTSPEVLVQALSGMTLFDPHKWGVYAPPYDEEDVLAAQQRPPAISRDDDDADVALVHDGCAVGICVSPAWTDSCDGPVGAGGPDGSLSAATLLPGDNSSFVPSPGASSRPGSPASEAHSSFGSAPADYVAPGSVDITPVPPAKPAAKAASPCAPRRLAWPGTVPAHLDRLAAAVASVERPERAGCLADCLDPESIGERQHAAATYRLEVLRVCGAAGSTAVAV
uniref:Uncharacterized protein n=1 Tax=Neobodo designis TaxID=312471 RepID=A0A7S1QA55_NEODS|mmetsp:Transcript_36871/g.113856  ORF Transcript_36871/g.113856 Transcript_36871/m.113856 type:complete len:418 (+) Transcript_36871:619-1872(+)|eukprot:CAMPEP_0174833994 /NCGR_PEP_ID=MMETSP1114-20130205/4566_1 /TAXON_ID=312471 /ORGANISM="Neobodo designis, Strain CCAP 1951/1" /LENGTH=417 /DNA_ID=CAMNT_0016067899 /DNA_START=610 /DNA_END=1863 /DNA_ORIENTATION=-